MKAKFRILFVCLLALSCLTLSSSAQRRGGNRDTESTPSDSGPKDPLENLKFRNLGPAAGGGRVAAVVGIPNEPNIYYVGAAAGGVFKTMDGGLSWKPIFEKEAVASIGAIALAPSNPNLVWVGTGESNIRNDVATGKGVYLSTDAGANWKFMGLKNAGQIANIIVDPNNPNIVFVGVLGHAWGPNTDRGVFRTTDGGKTWDKVLFVNDTTGVSSLIMDPTNSMVLYAGMWQMVRHPWNLDNGGPGSAIYRSIDGGNTWKKLTEGLPEGPYGNMGLAVAPSNPRHIYALVEAKHGLLWDSQDMGDHWREVSNNHALDARPFYFSEMAVAPNDESHVYFLSFNILGSTDGGKTAQVLGRGVHPDNHTIWIDPHDPERIILGNDGGVYVSHDAGRSWRFLNNLPIEQFYQVAEDDATPYMLCGGLQDNNGWCGASNTVNRSGIGESDWFTVVGGDGEYVVPASGTSHNVFADSQNGSIQRVNVSNGLSKSLRPYLLGVGDKKPADLKYRFNWTTPIMVNPANPDEVYMGGNVIFKSTDAGAHWKPISPDLTRNDKTKQESSGGQIELDLSGAETFDCVLSMSLSPADGKVIWAGTDDGVIQVTQDGGDHWSNVTPKGLPEWGRLQQIEASPFDAGTAYAAVDFHEIDNDKPYVFKTHDFGKTWTAISEGLPDDVPARVIRENPNRKGFLVLGTDTGLYYSYDDGAKWTALKSNFPTTPIYDIKFVKKSHDLVVATHGRGLFVMDNITPLEESTGDNSFHVYSVQTANHWHFWNKGGFSAGSFVAPNPPSGAVIDYYLPNELKPTPEQRRKREGPVKIVITDADGKMVRTLYGTSKMGYNRTTWDLRYSGPKRLNFLPQQGEQEENPFFDRNAGPAVVPGTYKVTVSADGKSETKTVEVALDPRFPQADVNGFKAQVAAGLEVRDEVSALNEALNRINSLRKQLTSIEELLGTTDENGVQNAAYKPVLDQARQMRKKLDALETPIYNRDIQPGASDDLHYLSRFQNRLQRLGGVINSGYAEPPNELAVEEMADTRKELDQHLKEINDFLNTEVVAFNKLAIEKGSSTLFAGSPITVKSSSESAPGAQEEDNDNQ